MAVAIPAEAIVVEVAEVIPVVATVAAVAEVDTRGVATEVDTQVVEVAAEAAVDIADKIRWSVRPPYFLCMRACALVRC